MPVLVEGRDLLKEELGRDKELVGGSVGKKFDFRRRGDGEGGICDNVSTVLSTSVNRETRRGITDGFPGKSSVSFFSLPFSILMGFKEGSWALPSMSLGGSVSSISWLSSTAWLIKASFPAGRALGRVLGMLKLYLFGAWAVRGLSGIFAMPGRGRREIAEGLGRLEPLVTLSMINKIESSCAWSGNVHVESSYHGRWIPYEADSRYIVLRS